MIWNRLLVSTGHFSLRKQRSTSQLVVVGMWLSLSLFLALPSWAQALTRPTPTYSPNAVVFTLGSPIAAVTPNNTGGAATSWSVAPALPSGLTFDTPTGQISGTPSVLSTIKTYTVTAANAAGSRTTTIRITVNAVAPALSYSPSSATFSKGTAVSPLVPINGGGSVVTWTITPALSAGLAFSNTTGQITGTPTAIRAATAYTIKGTNTGGSSSTVLTLTVIDIPPVISYNPVTRTFTKGTSVGTVSPTRTGGTVISWSISPTLPAGLSFATTTGRITGTPTTVSPAVAYTISATNTGGTATTTLTISVRDSLPAFSFSPSANTYTIATPIVPLSPTLTGGAVVSWSVTPALPAGLSLNTTTGILSGTPTAAKALTTYTVRGTNGTGTGSSTMRITVNNLAPVISYSPTTYAFTKGTTISTISPTSSGGAIGTWAVSPALPAGLSLNPTTGQITGTPTTPLSASVYTVTASNGVGSFSAALNLTVKDLAPVIAYSPSSYAFNMGTSIPPIVPTSSGGAVVSWAIAPALPSGLSFNGATGQVSGVPTAASAATPYTVTATNSGGAATASLSITVTPSVATPVVNLATYVTAAKPGLLATTQDQGAGVTYTWSLTNGAITAGQGTRSITYTAGSTGSLTASGTATSSSVSASGSASSTVVPEPQVPSIFAQAFVHPDVAPILASVPDQPGVSLQWSLSDGAMQSNPDNPVLTYLSPKALGPSTLTVTAQNQAGDVTTATRTVQTVADRWLRDVRTLSPLYAHKATLLADGRVLVTGGYDNIGALGTSKLYDQATQSWSSTTGQLTTARGFHTATLLGDGKVLVTGGVGSVGFLGTSELYDPASQTWIPTTGGLSAARYSHTATLLGDGKVLVTGGYNNTGALGTSELYDPATQTWSPTTGGLTALRYSHTATLLGDGKVLVTGGYGNGGAVDISELYDPASQTWSPTTGGLATARVDHTATLLGDGKVLVAGGSNSGFLGTSELYDPATQTWSPTTGGLTTARTGHTATLLSDGRVLVTGGQNGGILGSSELYDPASQTWSSTPVGLMTERSWHKATLLWDGKVLLTGGQGAAGTPVGNPELYDPSTATSATVGQIPGSRGYHTATTLRDGRILIAGGGNGNNGTLNSTAVYDPRTNEWASSRPLLTQRQYHTSSLMPDGRVLVTGGTLDSSPLDSTEIYNPTTDTWISSGNLSYRRSSHTATLLTNGKVLVVGGNGPTGITTSVDLFDPVSGTWSPAGNLNFARCYHTAHQLSNGWVMVVGGFGPSGPMNSTELYDPANNTWTVGQTLVNARGAHTATRLTNGLIMVAGGSGPSGLLASAELYDPATGNWTTAGSLSAARYVHTATLLDSGRVLVTGGQGNVGYLASAEVYDPVTNQWSATGALGTARGYHTATPIFNERVLVFGGDGPIAEPEFWEGVRNPSPSIGYSPSVLSFNRGVGSGPSRPLSTGGTVLSWSISPSLPPGLTFDVLNGYIYGAPAVASPATVYTVTGTNTVGTATTLVTLAVNDNAPMVSYIPSTYSFTAGTSISAVVPTNTGGAVVVWSIAPSLPNGLAFDVNTGQITGTPTSQTPPTNYLVTASNTGGSSSTLLSLSVVPAVLAPLVNLPPFITTAKPGLLATTQDQGAGVTYAWSVSNGTITAGQGTPSITYTAGSTGSLTASVTATSGSVSASGSASTTVVAAPLTPVIFAQAQAHPGDSPLLASIPDQPGMTILWNLVGGTVLGSPTNAVLSYQAPATVGPSTLSVSVQNQAGDVATAYQWVQTVSGQWLKPVRDSIARANHTETLLRDGRLLLVGGKEGSGYLSSAELFDPATNTWTDVGSLASARAYHTATLLGDGTVLVAGGRDQSGAMNTWERYDPTTRAWTSATAVLVTGRYSHTATLLTDGTVLVAGGYATAGESLQSELFDPAAQTWTRVGDLHFARFNHTATLLTDGTVMVAGGFTLAGVDVPAFELYDPATKAWTSPGALLTARHLHTATRLSDGTVLVSGGLGATGYLASNERYNPTTKVWSDAGVLTHGRSDHTAAALPDGTVMVTGGIPTALAYTEKYDPATNAWSLVGDLNIGRQYHTATTLENGKVLVAGGNGAFGFLSAAELYDPLTALWTPVGTLTSGRSGHTATTLTDGTVLIAGGATGSGVPTFLDTAEVFEPTTNSWNSIGRLSTTRGSHTATLLTDGTVLVAGGNGPLGYIQPADLYDPATKTWTNAGNLNSGRSAHTATLLANGKVLVTGGVLNSGLLQSTELYDPATRTWTLAGNLNAARRSHTATLLMDGTVMVTGGLDAAGNYLASTELFDPTTQQWISAGVGSLTIGRFAHTATLLPDGTVLVLGGAGIPGVLFQSERFNPVTRSWSDPVPGGGLTTGRYFHSATILGDGTVLVTGGLGSGGTNPARSEKYDPATNRFVPAGAMNTGRYNHSAVLMGNGKVMAFGGQGPIAAPEFWK